MTTTTSDQKMSERTPKMFAWRERDGVRAVEALAHRVERARADVAVDDAEGQQREREEAPAARLFAVMWATVHRRDRGVYGAG